MSDNKDIVICCLACIGIPLAIILLIVNQKSFFIALIVGIIIYGVVKYQEKKRLEREQAEQEEIRTKKEKIRKEVEKKQRESEAEQRAKGLVKFENKWGTPEQVKKWKEIEVGLNNNFADLSPYEFEEFIAKLFRKMGYSARKTVSTGDFGADVIAKKEDETIIIEVKKYSIEHNITPKEVQRTLGAMWKHKADKAVFVTTSDFTVRAREVEKEGPIELWNKKIFQKMVRKYFIELETEKKNET